MTERRDPGELWGSRTLGTERQLFRVNAEDEEGGDGDSCADVELRPHESRATAGLAQTLAHMDFPAMCSRTIKSIDHIEEASMTTQAFKLAYEKSPSRPAIISGCTSRSEWPAGHTHWAPEVLQTSLGADTRLEVSQQDCTVSLGEYVAYLDSASALSDDNPVYIFETLVDGHHDELLRHFHVPRFFTGLNNTVRGCHLPGDSGDLLSEAGEDGLAFGLHRWFLLGARHSGSNLHQDPLGTSAWNTLLLGKKLWVLFPPDTPLESLHSMKGSSSSSSAELGTSGDVESGGDSGGDSSLQEQEQGGRALDFCAGGWFAHLLPHLPPTVDRQKLLFVQEEGETVFVPAGWHHAVLNLSTTVCVTQNYASPYDYLEVAKGLYAGCATTATTVTATADKVNDDDENGDDSIDDCGGSVDAGEAADEWRLKVTSNYTWQEMMTDTSTNKHLNLALDFCVHCSQATHGNVCTLLDNRPVCESCEASATFRKEYALLSMAEVRKEFGMDLTGEEGDEGLPPSIQKKGIHYFLRNHILQMVQEEEGGVEGS